ncbi:MAG: calcium-binding protein [Pseudomonadota bacterium]
MDPLVLDLDGNGFQTIAVNNGRYFDFNSDGCTENTGWVGGQDGLLALDRNGDGQINNGAELFGSETVLRRGEKATNGFAALAEFDANRDGIIDASDPVFSQLRVIKYERDDSILVPDMPDLHFMREKLLTFEELGIKSISLDSVITNTTDAHGNTQTRLGSFERTDGTAALVAEYSFQQNAAKSYRDESIPLPSEYEALPNIADIGLRRKGDDLFLWIKDTNDSVTMKDYFLGYSNRSRIEPIQFMDGTVWTDSDVMREMVKPTEGPDSIYGGIEGHDVRGLGGDHGSVKVFFVAGVIWRRYYEGGGG